MLAPTVFALTGVLWATPALDARVAAVSPERLAADLTALQSVPGATRFTGTPGARAARAHLEARLSVLGLPVAQRAFVTDDPFMRTRRVGVNLWTRLQGAPGAPPLVLVAHLDTKGAKDRTEAAALPWRATRDPAPGADDNASGAAALLELARALRGGPLGRPVILAWTDAEELTEVGPDGFMRGYGADALVDALDLPAGATALSVDMLLRARPYGHWLRVYTDGRADSVVWAEALAGSAAVYAPAMVVDHRVVPSFVWSDHGAFWAVGLGGALLIEDDFHHVRYHRATDRWAPADGFYDLRQLVAATRVLVGAVGGLAGLRGAAAPAPAR